MGSVVNPATWWYHEEPCSLCLCFTSLCINFALRLALLIQTRQCSEEGKDVSLVSTFLDLGRWQASPHMLLARVGSHALFPSKSLARGIWWPHEPKGILWGGMGVGSGFHDPHHSHRHYFKSAVSGWCPPQGHGCNRLLAHSWQRWHKRFRFYHSHLFNPAATLRFPNTIV